MTLSPELLIVAGLNLVAIAATWGDLRRQVTSDRERNTDRHHDNQAVLKEIGSDVKRINGTVREHTADLKDQGREIDRLRDQKD